jgi:UDPglucose--hexose-1-phosphate uridylyltransferase
VHELRKDPLIGRWVAVLGDSWEPAAYESLKRRTEEAAPCPLCPGGDSLEEVASLGAVRVVRSPAPVLFPHGDLGRRGVGMYDRMNSIGVTEIVIESPEHDRQTEDLGSEHMRTVIHMHRERMMAIGEDERIRYILVSKSVGVLAGSVNSHPHSQILAAPVIPLRIKTELDGAKEYYSYKDRCIFCDMRDEEARSGERVILETEHFMAFCPYASKFPFEFWVIPKRHTCAFRDITGQEVADLGGVMATLLGRMKTVLQGPSYSYVLHTAPNRIPRRNHWHTLGEDYHWHIEVAPRLLRASGFEWGSGFYVLNTSPEDAAGYLREG